MHETGRAQPPRIVGCKAERFGTLVIVDVSGEDDVDAAFLEERGEQAHLLFGVMGLGGVEARMMEEDHLPLRLGLREIPPDPGLQIRIRHGHVAVGVETEEMPGPVVEGVVAQTRIGGSGGRLERLLLPGRSGNRRVPPAVGRTVQRRVEEIERAEAVGNSRQIRRAHVVVPKHRVEDRFCHEGESVLGRGIADVAVDRPEVGHVFADPAARVDDVAADHEQFRPHLRELPGDGPRVGPSVGHVAHDREPDRFIRGLARGEAGFSDRLLTQGDPVIDAAVRTEIGEQGRVGEIPLLGRRLEGSPFGRGLLAIGGRWTVFHDEIPGLLIRHPGDHLGVVDFERRFAAGLQVGQDDDLLAERPESEQAQQTGDEENTHSGMSLPETRPMFKEPTPQLACVAKDSFP